MSGAFPAAAVHWASAAIYLLAVAWAVVSDARRLIIPNWAPAAIALAFLPAALAGGLGLAALGPHYGIGLAMLAIGLVLFRYGILGGGDVKLLAAVGVWIGLADLWLYLVTMAFLGGALALTVMAAARLKRAWPALGAIPWLGDGGARSQSIPYGIAIGLAALALAGRNQTLPPAWAAFLH